MKLQQQKLLGARLGEVRIMYRTGTPEETTILTELDKALDAIRDAGITIEDYTDEDRQRFNGMDD